MEQWLTLQFSVLHIFYDGFLLETLVVLAEYVEWFPPLEARVSLTLHSREWSVREGEGEGERDREC